MRFVIPLAGGRLTAHFGHCEQFAVVDADPATGQVVQQESLTPPPHQPGLLPPWLAERGAEVIIAGGMGVRAQQLFADHDIQVVVGAPLAEPVDLVRSFLAGSLQSGTNLCDH